MKNKVIACFISVVSVACGSSSPATTSHAGGSNAAGGGISYTGGAISVVGGTTHNGGSTGVAGSGSNGGSTNTGGTTTSSVTSVTAISAGYYFTCAIVNSGAEKCWGYDASGELGDSVTFTSATQVRESFVPVQVQGLTSGVTAVASGSGLACAVVNGAAQCWGDDTVGQLGNGVENTNSLVPVQVQGLTTGVTAITASDLFACVIVNGGAQCWGNNGNGQLGNNSTVSSSIPVQVQGMTIGVTAIDARGTNTCVIVSGSAQCWGPNPTGQLGNNAYTTVSGSPTVPVQVQGLTSGVTAIAVGTAFACAVVNGGVQCWGKNSNGQLGSPVGQYSLVPVQVQGLTSDVTAITAGDTHACAIVNGGVQCWGNNGNGQLGNNSTTNSASPVQVQGLTSGVMAISAGFEHTCTVVNGGAQCWGSGTYGALSNKLLVSSGSDRRSISVAISTASFRRAM